MSAKKKIAYIVTFCIFCLIFTGFVLRKPSSVIKPLAKIPSKMTTEERAKNNIQKITGTIEELYKQGKDIKCTFNKYERSTKTTYEGTVYVATVDNKQISRTEMRKTNEDASIEYTTSLVKDKWMYMWDPERIQGIMMDTTTKKPSATDANETSATPVDFVSFFDNFTYDCENWQRDDSYFEVPSEKNFIDITKTIESIGRTFNYLCVKCEGIQNAEERQTCKTEIQCP